MPLAVCFAVPSRADWQLTLLDSRHDDPGDVIVLSEPVLSDTGVAYWTRAFDVELGGREIVASPGGVLQAFPPVPLEDGSDQPGSAATDAASGSVLLTGLHLVEVSPGFSETAAIYEYPGFARLAYIRSTFPGFDASTRIQIANGYYDGEGAIVFGMRDTTNSPGPLRWAVCRGIGGGAFEILAESGVTEVPGAGGEVFQTIQNVVASEGVILFFGETAGGRRGIYQIANGQLATVVDNQTPLPGMASPPSMGSASAVQYSNEGQDVAVAFFEGLAPGIWTRIGGTWSHRVSTSTPIPGGSGNFGQWFLPGLRDGKLYFVGGRDNQFLPPRQRGVFSDARGALEPVVTIDSELPGDVPTEFRLAPGGRSLGDREVVFIAERTSGGPTWFREVYRAVPEPSGAAANAAAIAVLLALRRCARS